MDLGVNIDHVATLRQVRGTPYPDPVMAARLAQQAGAELITLHLREDRRHIQEADLIAVAAAIDVRLNLEIAITDEMLDIACAVAPSDICLVPERRHELTTEGGLAVTAHAAAVSAAVARLAAVGACVSLFIDPDPDQVRAARDAGAPAVELHTGAYADAPDAAAAQAQRQRIVVAAQLGRQLGLRVNAGHGLHYENVQAIAAIADLSELNIGHAIVARALFVGWEAAIRHMKALIIAAPWRWNALA